MRSRNVTASSRGMMPVSPRAAADAIARPMFVGLVRWAAPRGGDC